MKEIEPNKRNIKMFLCDIQKTPKTHISTNVDGIKDNSGGIVDIVVRKDNHGDREASQKALQSPC